MPGLAALGRGKDNAATLAHSCRTQQRRRCSRRSVTRREHDP
jgi:hypothetical protein